MFIEIHNGRPGYETQKIRINIQYITDYGELITLPEKYKKEGSNFKAKTWLNIYHGGQYYVQETVEQIDNMINNLVNQYSA